MLYGDRNDMRQVFVTAYRKHSEGQVLQPLESLVADIIDAHPEYHALLEDERIADEYTVEAGKTNPFLHMALHIAIREQLAVDRPPGVREAWQKLLNSIGDPHLAEHRMVDCLAEALHEAQRTGQPPDEQAYLAAVRRL